MLQDHVAARIASAPFHALDTISSAAIKAWGEGQIDDAGMEAICSAIHGRRTALRAAPAVTGTFQRPASLFPPRSRQRSPKSPAKIERRRMLGTSSALPPAIRARFTLGEVAVLVIVIEDVKAKGYCDASLAEIATRAGCGPTLARGAIRMAETLGLFTVTQRPRKGAKHLTNVIRVMGAELIAWIERGGHRVQKSKPLPERYSFEEGRKAKLKPYSAMPLASERSWKDRSRRS